jgi:hypothetical protein
MERLQQSIKVFVLRMESEVYKKMRADQDTHYKSEMNSLFREIYGKINNFEELYFETLIAAYRMLEGNTEHHYEKLISVYEEEASIS